MPDYSKCWECGGEAEPCGLGETAYCRTDNKCVAWVAVPAPMWNAIHDRLAAVREESEKRGASQAKLADVLITEVLREEIQEESTLKERERCAKMVEDKWGLAICAARIREGK